MKLNELSGKTIVLTGTFATMKRAEAEKLLQEAGANVKGSISKATDLLVYGEKAGSKLSKAQSLGVAIMPEAELVALLAKSGLGADILDGDKPTAQQARSAEEMAPVRAVIEPVQASQRERLGGFTLPHLLLCWCRVFSQRPDVHVVANSSGAPAKQATLLACRDMVPPQMLAFHAELGSLFYTWVLTEERDGVDHYDAGYNGGRISLVGLEDFQWYPRPDWDDHANYEAYTLFDELQPEGQTEIDYAPGEEGIDAELTFNDANDCERYPLGTVEEYLTQGAQKAFVWYWPNIGFDGEYVLAQIAQRSVSRDTPPEQMAAMLTDRGLTADEARAMIIWLGENAHLLLPLPH